VRPISMTKAAVESFTVDGRPAIGQRGRAACPTSTIEMQTRVRLQAPHQLRAFEILDQTPSVISSSSPRVQPVSSRSRMPPADDVAAQNAPAKLTELCIVSARSALDLATGLAQAPFPPISGVQGGGGVSGVRFLPPSGMKSLGSTNPRVGWTTRATPRSRDIVIDDVVGRWWLALIDAARLRHFFGDREILMAIARRSPDLLAISGSNMLRAARLALARNKRAPALASSDAASRPLCLKY